VMPTAPSLKPRQRRGAAMSRRRRAAARDKYWRDAVVPVSGRRATHPSPSSPRSHAAAQAASARGLQSTRVDTVARPVIARATRRVSARRAEPSSYARGIDIS
jgi:hypothetical protein